MNLKKLLLIWPVAIVLSCNESQQGKTDKDPKKFVDNIKKMDLLEHLFTNDNWMMMEHTDTSYYYFSRNNLRTKVYHFKMNKGDSVNTIISEMNVANDSLVWNLNDSTELFLSSIDKRKAEWKKSAKDAQAIPYMFYVKKDERNINVVKANGENFHLVKTLPLSTFLIRSRYDFLHSTRIAFSDTTFKEKK